MKCFLYIVIALLAVAGPDQKFAQASVASVASEVVTQVKKAASQAKEVTGEAAIQKTAAPAGEQISWRVANPFRLFVDPKYSQMQIDLYHSLSEEEKKTPVLSMEHKLAALHERGWSEDVFTKTCWDEKRNRYRYCRGKGIDYINPKKHKVIMRFAGSFEATDRCEWTLVVAPTGGKKKKRHKLPAATKQAALCADEVSFDIPYPAGGLMQLVVNGQKRAETQIKVQDAFIVGLGDSFASGEGNPDDPVRFSNERSANYGVDPSKRPMNGYPTRIGDWRRIGDGPFLREAARWQSRACHRSLYSYQLRTALQLAIEEPHRAITFAGFACSGSEITLGLFLNYAGSERDRHKPHLPQLSYVSEELCGHGSTTPKDYATGYTQLGKLPELQNMILNKCYKPRRKIDLLLVSIGGNDVGFSRLVANAILADKTLLKDIGGWAGSVHGPWQARKLLPVLKTRYKALNKAFHYMLRIPWKQSDRILLTAYPRMELKEDGVTICPSGNTGMSLYPDFSVMNSKLKQASVFADELYKVMKESSKGHGWTFVDGFRDQFAAHGFCAVNSQNQSLASEILNLPRFVKGKWSGFKPASFKPYASRQRWIRTPDDAYMTVHFHNNSILSRRLMHFKRSKWFQVVLAGTYSGSFHPTAEGHAVIADSVVKRARAILKKYKN